MNTHSFEILAVPYIGEDQAAAATLSDNHSLWLRFIFTDNLPNLNSQGIKEEEFASLIKTGKHKPLKKVLGTGVAEDHSGAVPIGAIADMRQEGDQVIALASVWEEEFPDEADFIRQAYAAKTPLNVSWEVFYKDVETDEKGVQWLKNCSTRAATLVGNPAYAGRTSVLAVAARDKKGEPNMEIDELKVELETLKTEKIALEAKLTEQASMHDELETLRKEAEELRAYKIKVEADAARAALTKKRLANFSEAGIEMTEETFTAEADKWLGLDDAAFEFVLKALVNTKPIKREGQSNSSVDNTNDETDPKVIVRKLLQERKTPKQKDKES